MSSIFCIVDDKHVPLYRILWVADLPHFCGDENCEVEGLYEVRLEQDESLWANLKERDSVLTAMEKWYRGDEPDHENPWE